MVHSVRFVRPIRECWTSIASWDALKWPKWMAFPKTSSLWDAAYEEVICYNKDGEQVNTVLNMFATFMRKPSMMILYYITSGFAPGRPIFRICVQKHNSPRHRFPALPLDDMAL